jgi:hypothetical protein
MKTLTAAFRLAVRLFALAAAMALAGCNSCSAARSASAGDPPPSSITTRSVLAVQSPACADCATRNGCLDPAQQGGSCELADGRVLTAVNGALDAGAPLDPPDPGYTANCLRTLADTFSSHCADSMTMTPCLCGGDTDAAAPCIEGRTPPAGPLVADYARSFNTGSGRAINEKFTAQSFGAGQANALVQCLAAYSCRCCFGVDGGAC